MTRTDELPAHGRSIFISTPGYRYAHDVACGRRTLFHLLAPAQGVLHPVVGGPVVLVSDSDPRWMRTATIAQVSFDQLSSPAVDWDRDLVLLNLNRPDALRVYQDRWSVAFPNDPWSSVWVWRVVVAYDYPAACWSVAI